MLRARRENYAYQRALDAMSGNDGSIVTDCTGVSLRSKRFCAVREQKITQAIAVSFHQPGKSA